MLRNIILNDGNKIPMVGFGTYKATDGTGYEVVLDAIKAGYRLLDTAKVYENEEDVGRAIKKSGIPREEFFITSKIFVLYICIRRILLFYQSLPILKE